MCKTHEVYRNAVKLKCGEVSQATPAGRDFIETGYTVSTDSFPRDHDWYWVARVPPQRKGSRMVSSNNEIDIFIFENLSQPINFLDHQQFVFQVTIMTGAVSSFDVQEHKVKLLQGSLAGSALSLNVCI
jgi:hypothetical protein